MKTTPRNRGAALVITLAMIAMLTFLIVAFLSRSVANLQIEAASTGSARAAILARSAGEVIISDFKSEIIAGSNVATSSSQIPIYIPRDPIATIPAVSRYASLDKTIFANLVKQSTGPFYPVNSPIYDSNVRPTIQTVTNITTDVASPNGRTVINKRWDDPAATLTPSGPLLLLSNPPTTPPTYTRFYTSAMLPHWIMMTRQGVPAKQDFTSDWANYSPDNSKAAIGRFAYNIYDVGGLLDVNVAGYEENSGSSALSVTAPGQKGSLGLAKLSLIPNMGTADPDKITNAVKFARTWRNIASNNTPDNYLSYLGYTKNGATDLTTTGFFAKGPQTGFLKAAVGTTSADNHLLGRQDLIRLAVKTATNPGDGPPYGLNINTLPYLTHFSREVNAPSWYPPKDADKMTPPGRNSPGINPVSYSNPYAYNTNRDLADAANRSFPNVRVGKNPTWRRITGEFAVDGEPLVKYRFPLSWLALLQDKDPTTSAWDLTPEATKIVQDLDDRNKANGNTAGLPGINGGTTLNDKAVLLVENAFGLQWDAANYRWTYVGSHASQITGAVKIAVLGDSLVAPQTTVPPTPTPVCRDNREPNFFELLKAGILSGSLGNASDFESMCANVGEDANPDYQVMQIGANIIDQADSDSYPTQIAFGYRYDAAPSLRSPRGQGNSPAQLETRIISGVEDLPFINSFVVTPYRLPAGQNNLNAGIPMTDSKQNAQQDSLDCWLQFVLWKPQQKATSTAAPTKFRIYCSGEAGGSTGTAYGTNIHFTYDADVKNPVIFPLGNPPTVPQGPSFGYVDSTPLMVPPTNVTFNDSADDFRAPTLLGGMGSGSLHGFLSSQPEGNGTHPHPVAANINTQLPRGMWLGEMYRPEQSSTNAAYAKAPPVAQIEFRCSPDIKIELQYDQNGTWRTYQQYDRFAMGTGSSNFHNRSLFGFADSPFGLASEGSPIWPGHSYANTPAYRTLDHSTLAITTADPRSRRYGLLGQWFSKPDNTTPSMLPPATWTNYLKQGWSPHPQNRNPYYITFGPGSSDGRFFPSWIGGSDNPWQDKNIDNYITDPTSFFADNTTTSINPTTSPAAGVYYKDMDGIRRRADGDSVDTSSSASNNVRPVNLTYPALGANTRDLGRVLNRPFRSIGELGYVFRDEPFKSLNLFTTNSGDSALLDLFSVSEQPAVVAGKVNLNTHSPEVLQAIIAGAVREEASTSNIISAADALAIATNLTNSIYGTTPAKPITSVAEIADRLGDTSSNGPIPVAAGNPDTTIKTRREIVGRALAGSVQTRTWNFLVDLIAQSGRFTSTASQNSQFVVDGEQRYWLHVAIDRYTGQVVDQQLEVVLE